MRYKSLMGLALAGTLLAGCDAPLDVDPRAAIAADEALNNARAMAAAVNGMYDALQVDGLYSRQLVIYPDMYADNLVFSGTFQTDAQVFNRSITSTGGVPLGPWAASYSGINQANEVLAAIPNVADLSQANATRFRGEALFLRSLHYVNLVRYFGGVPIITEPTRTTGDAAAAARPRNTMAEVYALIERDLNEAAGLLPDTRINGRATMGAAQALLSRVYLEQHKDAQARDMATPVINNGQYEMTANFADLWVQQNTQESIFEIQYTITDSNAQAFWLFPARGGLGGRWGYNPSAGLRSAFVENDTRAEATFAREPGSGRFYGTKYFRVDGGDDNVIVLRLAEMYLNRAEANTRLGADAAVVRADINVVRQRAELQPLMETVNTRDALIEAILQERRVEFALEGHRFFDLRRTGRAMEVLGIPEFRLLWPIPEPEMDVNEQLVQNPGY
ncbi:RagB/SusD family nutrient uptake outer membrane protein [soil metagenome]